MNDGERKEFGQYLKRLRIERGISLRQVEKAVGISNSYLYQIERRDRNPPKVEILQKLAVFYNVSFASLMAAARLQEPRDEDRYFNNIENAFEMVRRDKDYAFGTHLISSEITIEVKRFVVEMYECANNLKLLKPELKKEM